MEAAVAQRLLQINRVFYEQFAGQFDEARPARQPGYERLISQLQLAAGSRLLDVGCGNGRLAHLLDAQGPGPIRYVGADASAGLLEAARRAASGLKQVEASFFQVDVTEAGWTKLLPQGQLYDVIALLAVLHHIPGRTLRRGLLAECRKLLRPGGLLALSTWQFLNSERLRRKIVPWAEAGLDETTLEPGDYLLDWQRGGRGLRYCHLVDRAEIVSLAVSAGFKVQSAFVDDGKARNLNLFALLEA